NHLRTRRRGDRVMRPDCRKVWALTGHNFRLWPGRQVCGSFDPQAHVRPIGRRSVPRRRTAPQGQSLVPRAHRDRRRVRRYRDEPALYPFRHAERDRPYGPDRGRRPWDHLAHLLGTDGDGVAQIRRAGAARRQRRRRRNPGAVVAGGANYQWPGHPDPGPARHRGRGAALWRRRHHAGHFRAFRHGGPQARHAGARQLRLADHACDPDRAVRDTASRAMQVGLCPRMRIVPTSSDEAGQIYVPTANWLLMIGTLLIVVLFKTSENLAGAYGIAVSGTMLVTTILLYRVAIGRWQWPPALAIFIIVVFGAVDATFL